MDKLNFTFKGKWKEELVCSCEKGSFSLDLTIGFPTVYIPTKEAWDKKAPAWAKEYWDQLYEQLNIWCTNSKIPLEISENANVYTM